MGLKQVLMERLIKDFGKKTNIMVLEKKKCKMEFIMKVIFINLFLKILI